MVIIGCPISDFFFNIIRNIFRLIISCIKLAKLNLFSFSVFRPEPFFFSAHIIADHCICRIQNITCRTIILFQFDYCRIWKFLFKIQNIFNIRSPELINRLIIITNHTQISVFSRQKAHKLKLYGIRILILIYHNISKTFLIILQHIRLCLKQLNRLHQKIIKIQRIIRMHLLFILQIHFCDLLFSKIPLCI